jgi:MerR family transcriptional regulator, thiopeptide resistance regulator
VKKPKIALDSDAASGSNIASIRVSSVDKRYRVQEFAALTGVTVRALHHYDRLGLLRPGRNGSGYRLYGRQELERLEQIVALKFIGIPLQQIKAILDRNPSSLFSALRVQRTVLEKKRDLLDRAIEALYEAEQSLAVGEQPDARILKKIIEVIEMQTRNEWIETYYSPEAWTRIKDVHPGWSPQLNGKAYQDWLDLFNEVEAALGEDPASEKVQALAERWKAMEIAYTCGDPEIAKGLNKMFADKSNWPDSMKQRMAPFKNPAVWEFLRRVFASGSHRCH